MDEQRHWVWKREAMQDVSYSINLYWKNYASIIVDVLQTVAHTDVDMVREFMDGPFGVLMNFVGGTSCNTALHAVMAREIALDGAVEHEVWFHIGGTNIRFSPVEYALVTGLMFGGFDFDPYVERRISRHSFYSRVLSCAPISIHDLHHRFTHYMLGDDASDYLKVANVLFLYGMVLGYDPLRCIDDWVWVLVEDTHRWKFFPWGSYSFGVLLHYISLIPVELTAKRKAYHFYGPVWALQIWAYEAIPRVGRHCAILVSDVAIPRCLKWRFKNKAVRLGALFTEGELLCHIFLEPTENEDDLPYFRSTQLENYVGVPYVVKLQKQKRPRKVTQSRAVTPPRALTPPRAVTPPIVPTPSKVPTPPRAVTPHRAPTPPKGPTPATSTTRSTSRRSVGCLPRTCGETGAMDTATGPTSDRHRGKRVRASTSSSSTSEGHVCCRHVDMYREIAREAAQEATRELRGIAQEAAQEAARETFSRFMVEMEKRIQTMNELDETLFNKFRDFLTWMIEKKHD